MMSKSHGEDERRRQRDATKPHVYGDCPHCRKTYRVIVNGLGRAHCPVCLGLLENVGGPPKSASAAQDAITP